MNKTNSTSTPLQDDKDFTLKQLCVVSWKWSCPGCSVVFVCNFKPVRIACKERSGQTCPAMAAEPINIFSHKQDLLGIVAALRQMVPNLKITGSDAEWERITIEGKKGWLQKAPLLVLKNVPEYYTGPDWQKQVAGMQGYFSRFPDVPRKPDIFRIIRSFRFALATEFDPDLFLQSNDPRLKFLFAVAKHLDGVIFTPSGLWDAEGRALLCADGKSDPNAVLPAIPQAEQRPRARSGDDPDEQKIPQTPPDANRVARRALCLAAVSGRGLLEMEPMPQEQAEAHRKRILAWIGELALEEEFESQELKLLQQSVHTLSQQNMVDAGWRLEGLGALAWALGKFKMPAYDQLVDAGVLLPNVGFLNLNQATALMNSPALRPAEELRKFQDQCFALHWRLRNFRLDKRSMNFRTFARECWFGPLDVSSARFCDDDLAIGEMPIGKASEEDFRKALSTANERHLAINWLVEGGEIYSETDTST